jgi:hypothetical protein
MYIMVTEPISTSSFVSPSHQSLCLYVYPSYHCKATARLSVFLHSVLGNGSINMFPWQRINRTLEELMGASFSMRSMSYQRRVYGLCVSSYLCYKDVLAATKNCCLESSLEDSQSRQAVKCSHGSRGTLDQESLCWRGPAAI